MPNTLGSPPVSSVMSMMVMPSAVAPPPSSVVMSMMMAVWIIVVVVPVAPLFPVQRHISRVGG
ncbi:hypothetical protein RvY_06783 [Ramazzottius varieornatus]|uniref:Uncharacterized protein n=1 Tax=Ramazzottius varieornatus TaxID=947166 RepID=A0A1D1V611_RAMVA|nr:hypothetical protein RvY_06783 [Ramazzottius varieornatus]